VSRHSVLATGTAVAVTAALLNSLCAVAVALWPEESIRFANTWIHGLDLQMIKATAPLTLPAFLRGLIGIAAIGFITGVVYAWVYNRVHYVARAHG
jgi:2TM family of unknown function (DUF5676)